MDKIYTTSPEIDVCIIGAGLAGLTAAYKILTKESTLKLIILENEDIAGGQLYSTQLCELGGKWITPDQYHIYDLCRKLNVPVTRKEFSKSATKSYWHIDKGPFAGFAKFEVKRFVNEMNLKSEKYRPGTFRLSKDDVNMETIICSKLFFEQSRQFIRLLIRFITGVEASDISYTEFMSICQSSGNFGELVALFTSTSSMMLEFSSEQLIKKLEKAINPQYIFHKTKVVEVVHYSSYALVRDNKNNVYRTSVLIVAIPWQMAQRIIFYPPIPSALRIPIFENRYMITSFLAQYTDSYWRRGGFSGNLILHNPHMICYEYRPFVYGGMIAHEEDFDGILQPIILNRLSDAFGVEMGTPVIWQQKTWEQPSLLNLPATTAWNQIIWSSTTSATCFRGCLSGAVQSGYRAALNALLNLRPQNVTWQDVNEIQRASVVRRRHSWITIKLCSLNLYNSTFYVIVTGILIVGFKCAKFVHQRYPL